VSTNGRTAKNECDSAAGSARQNGTGAPPQTGSCAPPRRASASMRACFGVGLFGQRQKLHHLTVDHATKKNSAMACLTPLLRVGQICDLMNHSRSNLPNKKSFKIAGNLRMNATGYLLVHHF